MNDVCLSKLKTKQQKTLQFVTLTRTVNEGLNTKQALDRNRVSLSNIKREMLAGVHGLEKFHYYAYGPHVTCHDSHYLGRP